MSTLYPCYPSPPSSCSQNQRTVPLPSSVLAGGVLDSPLIMSVPHIPLSPPPTLPTITLALPDTGPDFSAHTDPHRHPSPPQGPIARLVPADARAPGSDAPPPLSPLSPDWMSTKITIAPDHSALLQPHKACDAPHSPDGGLFLPSISQYASGSLWEPPHEPLSPRTTPVPLDFYDLTDTRPHLPLLDIPESYDTPATHTDPDHWTTPMDVDEPPASPRAAPLHLLNLFGPESPPDPSFSPSLPDLDDIVLGPAPSSPSRRSVSALPDFDMDTDPFLPSPSHRLLALPGADADHDLLPALPGADVDNDLLPTLPNPPPHGRSLLLITDPADVPPPRSPSPEAFDLDDATLRAQCALDPALQRLCDLRARAVAAERAARAHEAQVLEQGPVHMRAEARRVRKLEKERCREIGALLRLKVGCAGAGAEGARKQKKGPRKVISSLAQLVARMVFRRRETARPLANRRAGVPREYVRSALSRAVTEGGVYASL